jgi:hypothetical protein
VNAQGVTIYYNYLNGVAGSAVAVTFRGNEPTDYDEYMGDVRIPDTVTNGGNTYAVTTIGMAAFGACFGLTSVFIPPSVTTIDLVAFMACLVLTSIDVDVANPNYSSDAQGILYNKLQTELIQCPGAKMGNIIISNTVTDIAELAFAYCYNLTAITISKFVTTIGEGAFSGCFSLISIDVDATNPNYSSDTQGILYNKLQTELMQCPAGKTGSVTVPNAVVAIATAAFASCLNLTAVTIGSAVTTIGDVAFGGCTGLTSITSLAVNPPQLGGTSVFLVVPTTIPVHVPCGSVAAYRAASGWSAFSDYSDCIIGDNIETYDAAIAGISIYPNPVQNAISLVLPEHTTQASFSLYDMQGRLLLKQTLTAEEQVMVSHLSSGIYLYTIDVNGKRQMGKIVKR